MTDENQIDTMSLLTHSLVFGYFRWP